MCIITVNLVSDKAPDMNQVCIRPNLITLFTIQPS